MKLFPANVPMHKLVTLCLGVVCVLALPYAALSQGTDPTSASVTVGWTAPTTNEDGTPLDDLGGYKLYYGLITGNYGAVIEVGTQTVATITNLQFHQVYYVAVTAYDLSGNESDFSTELPWAYDDLDVDRISDTWEVQYFGSNEAADGGSSLDPDGDGVNNLGEYIAGTIPTSRTSSPQVLIELNGSGILVTTVVPPADGDAYVGYDRFFSVQKCVDVAQDLWTPVPGMEVVPATGLPVTADDDPGVLFSSYRANVWLQ